MEQRGIQHISVSPSGKKFCTLRSRSTKNPEETVIEIFSDRKLLLSKSFPQLHGKIYPKPPLGGISWSKDENKLIYVAEPFKPKSKSFSEIVREAKNPPQPEEENPDEKTVYGENSLYTEDWGECLKGVHSPKLYIFDLKTLKSQQIKGIPTSISTGEPQFVFSAGKKGENVVFVGYDSSPWRKGIYAYNTRPTKLFLSELPVEKDSENANAVALEIGEGNVSHLRVSGKGDKIAFFSTTEKELHMSSTQLKVFDLREKRISVLIDLQKEPESEKDFPGIFSYSQPSRIWGENDRFLFFSSFFRSIQSVFVFDLEGKSSDNAFLHSDKTLFEETNVKGLWRLKFPEGKGYKTPSVGLLDVFEDKLLCSVSSPSNPSSLWALKMGERSEWIEVVENQFVHNEETSEIKHEVLRIDPTKNKNIPCGFEAILITPKNVKNSIPLVVKLHGGPHGVYPTVFIRHTALLVHLGFAVCAVNYRGSIGFGQKFLRASTGCDNEIQDILDSIDVVVKHSKGKVDEKRIGIVGGSHGGFLTCKAIAKHPEKFNAAVAFNPVTNIPVLAGVTDIPEWSFVEAGAPLRDDLCPGPEEMALMHSYSPISDVATVKTPTMFLLGEKDARVPYLHNKAFINSLKAQGVDCQVHLYKDGGHSLMKTTEMKFDSDINSALWLCKYLLEDKSS